MRFSENVNAKGREEPQIDSMDHNLRTSLWDILVVLVFEKYFYDKKDEKETLPGWETFFNNIYVNFLKLPLEDRPEQYNRMKHDLQKHFFSTDPQFTYDFLQFMSEEYDHVGDSFTFDKHINFVLEREMADHKFIDGELRKINVMR